MSRFIGAKFAGSFLCFLVLATCAFFTPEINAETAAVTNTAARLASTRNGQPPVVQSQAVQPQAVQPQAVQSQVVQPYDAELASLQARMTNANAPETAVLLSRAYRLREYVDDPAAVTTMLTRIAADPRQHALVRDEALHYMALIDVHANDLAGANAKLSSLGFVRAWSVVGPFAGSQTNEQLGPEAGYHAGRTYRDSDGKERSWRTIPAFGPREWFDLSDLYPRSANSLAFATTSIYSERPQTVALRFSADAATTVFVNGRQLKAVSGDQGYAFDQYALAVALNVGWNSVVLKLSHVDGPWRFGLRVSELNGGELSGGSTALRASATQEPNAADMPSVNASAADLVEMARANVPSNQSSDTNAATSLETLGELEHIHALGQSYEHLEAAARRTPTAARWIEVAERCGDSTCRFSALQHALHSDPENERARVALANYYFGRGQLEKARDLLCEAIQREPGDYVAQNGLADLFISVGLNAEALKKSERLAHDFPKPLWLRRKLAARYLDLGLLERAHSLLTSALRDEYDDAQARSLMLRIYERRHDASGLHSAYEDMLRLNPADTSALADLASLAAGAGDYASATQRLNAALALSPDDDMLHERVADVMARAGHANTANQELAKALQINPNLQKVRQRLELNAKGQQADGEVAYLSDPAELAAQAHRMPPAPDSNAVTLANIRVERVYDNGLSAVREQQVYYIATDQGVRDFSTRSVQYSPATQELRVLHARVYKRDGRVLEAEEAGDGHVADLNIAMYYDVRSRTVRFPALEIGDVIELDYRILPTTSTNAYGDYFGNLIIFRTSLATELQRYVLITPARRQFNILEERMTHASVTEQGDQRIYRWETRDMPPLSNEARGPAVTDIAPYVHISTFQSWDDLGRWYAQLINPQFALDATLREEAARLVKNAHTEQERISAIHQFVLHNTHYVAMEFGIYSYKPYPVTQVYARRFGDCKDKASLMIALLRQVGIDAELALVRTRRLGGVDPQATSIALFNHAIVHVPKYDMWLDGTAEYAGSRELPLDDQGATALTVSYDGHAQLHHIPVTQPTDNYTRRTVRAQVMQDGRIQFSGVAYTRGEDAPGLRREYETPERQRDAVRSALAEVFPTVKVDDVRVDGANDVEHPVTIEFTGALDTFTGRQSVPLAASWMPRSYTQQLASLVSRTQDLVLPAPWTTEEELHFELPAGATVKSMPADTVLQTAFGSASLHYERKGHEVVVHTSVQFRQLRITPEEYAQFRDFCQQVERAFRNEIKVGLRG